MNHESRMFVCSDSVADTQVVLDQKDLLDGLFDESGAVGAFAFLGDPTPETSATVVACMSIFFEFGVYAWYPCLFVRSSFMIYMHVNCLGLLGWPVQPHGRSYLHGTG